MPRAKSQPIFSKAARQAQTKSPADRIKELEELLKLNKGGFSTFAEDTGSSQPFLLPGRRAPTSAGIQASAVEPQQRQELPDYTDLNLEMPPLDVPQEQPTGEGQSGAKLFFDSIREMMDSQVPSVADQLEQIFQTQGIDYGIQSLPDGGVLMRSGAVSYDYQEPEAVQQRVDGGLLYSDGTVRYPGLQPTPGYDPGLDGLLQMLGLSGQAITQEYGNYNPTLEPGSGYNMGTDVRTRDLVNKALRLPIGAQVIQVLKDDGTQWGDQSGHQGYGNSVLLQLPSGEMIRLSHLDVVGDFQPGQYLQAGTYIGVPGATGNVTGEHLDLEYYDQSGQVSNPMNFSGFADPGSLMQMTDLTKSMSVEGITQPTPSPMQSPQQTMAPQQQPMMAQAPMEGGSQLSGNIAQAGQNLGIPRIGASELARGDIGAAAQELQGTLGSGVNTLGNLASQVGVGTQLGNAPEGFVGAGEAISGDLPAAGRELSSTIERVSPTGQRIDLGISELLRGDTQGAQRNLVDTAQRVGERVSQVPSQVSRLVAPPVNAADGTPQPRLESLQQNLQGAAQSAGNYIDEKTQGAQDALSQAGSGVGKLFSKGSGALVNLFSRPQGSQIAGKRAIGETGSQQGNVLGSPVSGISAAAAAKSNDITDPFFKSELFKNVQGFAQGGKAPTSGALSLDVFNEDFYHDPGRVQSVFGKTFLEQPATAKFEDFGRQQSQNLINQLKQQYGNPDEYDQADLERIISSIPEIITQTPNLPTPKRVERVQKPQPSLSDYLAMGKTAAQWFAETGRQSEADAAGGVEKAVLKQGKAILPSGKIAGSGLTSEYANYPGNSVPSTYQDGKAVLASGKIAGSGMTSEYALNPQNSAANQSRVTTSTAPASSSKPSVFSSAYSTAKNLFNRFFN